MALICDTSGIFALYDASNADHADVVRCVELLTRYQDLDMGLADATVVATAERLALPRLLSLDQRHFRAIRPRNFSHFILLPADAA